MPIAHPSDAYNPVPTVAAEGGGGTPMGVRSSPEDFGGQVAGAVEKAGEVGFEEAQHFQDLINETAANQSEMGFLKASGDLKAKYAQYEGLQAEAMRPQYEKELTAMQTQYGQNLPMTAQHNYNMATRRTVSNFTSDYATYSASQVKSANLNSNNALADMQIAHAGNLSAVTDDRQLGEMDGNITHAVNAVADTKGWASAAIGMDSNTGRLTFGDDAQGKAVKAQYDEFLNEKLSKMYLTGAKTVADSQGVKAAGDWAQKHWDMMPDQAKVAMNAYLAPKMVNENIDGAIAAQNAQLAENRNQQLTANIPSSPTAPLAVRNNNPGNLRDAATGQFRVFDTPEAGATAMQSDLTAKISGNSPAMEAKFGKGYSPTLSNLINTYAPSNENNTKAYIDTVSKETGIAPTQALTAADIPKLQAAMTKVESGGSGGNMPNAYANQSAYPNRAEYLRSQADDYVRNVTEAVAKQYPDDYYKQQIARQRAENDIQHQIKVADDALKSDRDMITNAIGGGLSKGVPVSSYDELRALPGVSSVLDRVRSEQGAFASTIDNVIAKASRRDEVSNSPNGYDLITRSLLSGDHVNRIKTQDHLAEGLGSNNPAKTISWKDYQDAKPALDLDDAIKEPFLKKMQEISGANGNLDGRGQQRAVQWYNQAMAAYKQNSGDKAKPTKEFLESLPPAPMPSRLGQLSDMAAQRVKETMAQSIASKEEYDKAPSGTVFTYDGKQYRKP